MKYVTKAKICSKKPLKRILTPYRCQAIVKKCFHAIQASAEKYIQADLKNHLQIPSP